MIPIKAKVATLRVCEQDRVTESPRSWRRWRSVEGKIGDVLMLPRQMSVVTPIAPSLPVDSY